MARETFAFQGVAPVQARPSAGAHNGAAIIGGRSQGSVVNGGGPQTAPGPVAAGLGAYFEELMQPYVERKQKERFFQGFTAAASGIAVEELTSSGSPITKIFGPTGYEQGAQFYAANSALDKFSSEVLTDIDALRQMPPEEAARVLAEKSDSLMTGDSGANMLIQEGLMQRMGPVMNTVAKARMQWQQGVAVNNMTLAHDDAATAYQQIMVAQGQLSEPTAQDRTAAITASETFLSGRAKLEGMTDESYVKYLGTSAMSDITAGRFYAVEAMRRSGSWKLLDEETRTKLELAYVNHSDKALGNAAEAVVPDLIKLKTSIKMENVPGGAMGAAAELARINGKVKALTGTNEDLFDYKDFVDEAGSVVDVLVASTRRLESRREQLQDMQTRRGWQIEDREAEAAERAAERDTEEQEEAAAVKAMWGMGDIVGALAGGIEGKHFDRLALTEIRSGSIGGVVRAYKTGGWVSKPAANHLQAAVSSSIGEEYNADVGRSHEQWATLYKASPTAAAAYYGNLHAPMLRFHTMLQNNTPQNAFAKAFGNPTIYHPAAIPDSRKKEAAEMIPAAIDATESSSWNPWGRAKLNGSGLRTMTQLLTNRVATLATGDNTLSTQAIVNQALAAAQADGSIERYGAFAWGNRPGTPSLSSLVGLQGEEMDTVFTDVVDRKLKNRGFAAGADGSDYTITRMKLPNGHPGFHIEAVDEDGGPGKQAIITVADLRAYQQYRMDKRAVQSRTGAVGPAAHAKKLPLIERVRAYEKSVGITP